MKTHRQLITENDVRRARGAVTVSPGAIITPSARDLAVSLGIQIVTDVNMQDPESQADTAPGSAMGRTMAPEALAARIDHTNLSPGATADDIARLCDEAVRYGFAAVCVNPVRVAFAASRLRDQPVAVGAVAGFPSGGHDTAGKASEARTCVQNGAREIDMVANTGYLRDGSIECYHADIKAVRFAIGTETTLKVIIEAPLLEPAGIVRAAVIAAHAGADFVKTSTGVYASAREEDVVLLRRTLPPEVKIKAAGGIRSAARALAFLSLGAHRIGTSASVKIIEEFKNQSGSQNSVPIAPIP